MQGFHFSLSLPISIYKSGDHLYSCGYLKEYSAKILRTRKDIADKSIENIVDIAFQDKELSASIQSFINQGDKGFLVHIMPVNYMMQGLFIQPDTSGKPKRPRRTFAAVLRFIFPFVDHRNHQEMKGLMNGGVIRLVFSQLTWPDGHYAPFNEALDFTVKHLPLLRADVDTRTRQVLNIDKTAPRNY